MAVDAPPLATPAELRGHIESWERLPLGQRRIRIRRQISGDRWPRFFYKFRVADLTDNDLPKRLRGLLVDSRFWLSHHERFNDPFDMKAQVVLEGTEDDIRGRFDRLILKHGVTDAGERRIKLQQFMNLSHAEKEVRVKDAFWQNAGKAGICSFGNDPRSILMWTHYAQNHEGYCLQFSFAGDPRTFAWVQEVDYSTDEYPRVNWLDETRLPDALYTVLTRKHPGWAYENEWRFVHLEGADTLQPFRPEALVGIILGCRAPEGLLRVIRDVLEARRLVGFPAVRLYKAEQHPRAYELLIKGVK